jgi:hypothetical protein
MSEKSMPAIEWLKRIKDPEIRERALAKVKTHEYMPLSEETSISGAIMRAFVWDERVGLVGFITEDSLEWLYWKNLRDNPPALLPERTAEDEAREVLEEFAEWWNNLDDKHSDVIAPFITKEAVTDFLTHKYGKDETV